MPTTLSAYSPLISCGMPQAYSTTSRPRVTEPLVREAHALSLEIYAWTVNKPRDMERMAAWGVDVITTDYPERCRGVLYGGG